MTAVEPDVTTGTDDALHRVHHHTWDHEGVLRGDITTAMCGHVRRPLPNSRELPCCPLCAEIMHDIGLPPCPYPRP